MWALNGCLVGNAFFGLRLLGFFSSFDKSFDNGLSSWGACLSGGEVH